jgi:hypothetical protein
VYGTYKSNISTGTTARDIVADSDTFIVTVIDADLNVTTTISSNSASGGYNVANTLVPTDATQVAGSGFNSAGDKIQLTIADKAGDPIIGSVSDIKLYATGTATAVAGATVTSIDYVGDGVSNPALITIQCNFAPCASGNIDVTYPSSSRDTTTASVKSVVYTGAASVIVLTETGRNTGRFEGEMEVFERIDTPAGKVGTATTIPAIGGPITVSYVDAVTSGSATKVARTATYSLDTTVPEASITSPTTASESQSRLPSFTGTITDNGSGLDVSTFALHIDDTDDAKDTDNVISVGVSTNAGNVSQPPTFFGKIASIDMSAKTDGTNSLPFAYTETVTLPSIGSALPDHIVDFQARVADLAGNYGYSDSSTTLGNDGTGRHGNQPHTIKIDQIIPQIDSAHTGISWDTSVATPVEKADVNTSLVVRFDGKIKESSLAATDFQVTLSGAGGVFVPSAISVKDANVYLDIGSAIPSNNTPTVTITGTVQDLAGNSTDSGSKVAVDELTPVLTVVRSGGSGTGTGTEAADSLTKANMTVTITSDENLQAAPLVTVTDITTTGAPQHGSVGNVLLNTAAVSAGGNTWTLVIAKGIGGERSRAISVSGTDSSVSANAGLSGKNTVKAYVLDTVLSAPVTTPSGTTSQSNPFLTTDYSADAHTVTITSATLDTVDVMADIIASADGKTFFYQPTTALTNATHTYVVKSVDAAGNTNESTTTFIKSDRTAFVLELFAGWNSVSLPSDPLDSDVNSALSNSGITQVVQYDATTPSQPWRIASKVDDTFTSQTEPALSSITAGPGYWVESSNFEDQTVALSGPTGPGDARPGLTTIATGNGWNFVGVVDQSRTQTQKTTSPQDLTRPDHGGSDVAVTNATYFSGVTATRIYTFDTVSSKFREQASGDNPVVGTGMWVFITPQSNGQLPHIVP